MKQRNYRCTQQELYAACAYAWENCRKHLSVFSKFSPNYSEEYINERQREVEYALAMPDYDKRSAAAETIRIQLHEHNQSCLSSWRILRRYVQKSFPDSLAKAKMKDIGQGYYRQATSNNWESCKGLMVNGMTFLETEAAVLTAAKVMPADFPVEFKRLRDGLEALYLDYMNATRDSAVKTGAKKAANDKLYVDMITMCMDGQEVFRKDEVLRRQFVFEQILTHISGTSGAGIRGLVTNGAPGPIPALTLTLVENGAEAQVQEDGSYRFSQLAAGTYTVLVKALGHKDHSIPDVVVNTGAFTMLDIELETELG